MERKSGVLMHVSSLWGEYSCGSFGSGAREFVDFLKSAGFSYWQVLPFGLVDECNSPYKSYSTFGGNPICCAGALEVLRRLDISFLQQVRAKGAYLQSALEASPGITQVTGMGLMVGVGTERPALEVVEEARKRGVLLMTAKDRIRLLPPLNIPWKYLRKAASTISQCC